MTRLALLLCLALPAAAQDRPPLGQVGPIVEGLIATALAYEIGERCPSIDGRRVAGISYLLTLQAEARALGYSQEEIDAFTEDDVEKDRLEAVARARLRDLGALEADPETYCALGRAEIAAGTVTGSLLVDRGP